MRTSQKVRVLAALGTLSGAVWAGTFASFSDTATATAEFTTGDIVLTANSQEAHTFSTLSMADMAPGSSSVATLNLANGGSLDVEYDLSVALTAGTDAALADALTLQVRPRGEAADCTDGGAGALLVDHTLGTAAAETAVVAARQLGGEAADVLCVRVGLPADAANTLQAKQAGAVFTFTAATPTA